MNHHFLTPAQVAEILQVTEETILELLENRALHGVRVGQVWRIRDDQFDDFVENNATALPAASTEDETSFSEVDEYEVGERVSKRQRGGKKTNRYSALAEYLKRRSGGLVRLSFGEIEKIIGGPLPQSAREHRAWWANDKFHSQGKAWLSAGWVSEDLDLEGKEISFSRR